ncbi:MAG: DMT family transporter [Blastocatellia bacterium]|nr:DMT family transporter [Blastocatellia bacterium]MBL8196511.1 DMT family transporter [Blastocatellia bacterium]MBN8722431.1 DMT family transporter [Acidobacteriota bacterium]
MLVFAGESISLRLAAKANFSTGLIAFAQCTMAAIIQIFFGGRFSKVSWKAWWPALTLSALSGLSFYLAIRVAPVALVGLIEPLSLLPLMFAHRFIQERKLTAKALIFLVLLVIASCATVGQWPEKLSTLAILISCVGIASTGLSLVAGEVVKKDAIPSFVLAMQTVLAILSAMLVIFLGNSSLGGQSSNWLGSLAVGAVVGLIVSLAVSSLYYGMQHLGALKAGTIKILRLPVVALFGYILINEKGSVASAIALVMVVIFSILTIRFSSNTSIKASIKTS